jgi:hypothetical protein
MMVKKRFLGKMTFIIGVILALALGGCDFSTDDDSDGNGGGGGGGSNNNSNNPIQLIYNTWADGVILSSGGGQQWFKFTATEASQYIHISLGTLSSLYIQLSGSCEITV